MLYWIPYAFVRISVLFIAGIVVSLYFPSLIPIGTASVILLSLVGIYFTAVFYNYRQNRRVINPGFIGLCTIFLTGYCNVYFKTDVNKSDHLSNAKAPVHYYVGVINQYGQEKEKHWKEVLAVQEIYDGEGWKHATGNVLLYFPRKDFPSSFKYGDKLLIKGSPAVVTGPANPGQFDYQKFLATRNIYHQHFLTSESVRFLKSEPPSVIMDVSLTLRLWADAKLKSVVKGRQEQAIASALVLGVTDGLDNELMGAYAATGALHVLSVSGLHVGILYLLLMFVLKPVLRLRHGQWIIAGIGLFVLWVYACVTGLSPSVLRAVTMFSFLVVAKPLNQRTNIYNVLTASAFFLLLLDPFLILSVGFQLSYLAVFGIVYLHPLLYRMYEPESKWADELWKVTSVSIAAQAATFPLGLLYFHQFPNYFLLSNLYVLPLGFAILIGGLAVLTFSFVELIADFLGMLLELIIRLMNYLTFLTESLPYSVIDGINITVLQCAMLMMIVFGAVLFVQHRRRWMMFVVTACLLIFSLSSWTEYITHVDPPHISIYKVSRQSQLDLISSGTVYHLCGKDSSEIEPLYQMAGNRVIHHASTVLELKDQPFSRLCPYGRITLWKGKSILQITSRPAGLSVPVKVDYLILSGNSVRTITELPDALAAEFIIIDSSNSFQVAEQLLKSNSRQSRLHSVWHHGAFDKTI
jgi:competence protein ComEC